jgi:hypothetical protein
MMGGEKRSATFAVSIPGDTQPKIVSPVQGDEFARLGPTAGFNLCGLARALKAAGPYLIFKVFCSPLNSRMTLVEWISTTRTPAKRSLRRTSLPLRIAAGRSDDRMIP